MRHVAPFRISFDAVVERRRPPCESGNRLVGRTVPPLGIRIRSLNTGLDQRLQAIPLLPRPFSLHPPEHYMSDKEGSPNLSRTRFLEPTVEPSLGDFARPYAKALGDLVPTVTAPHQLEHGADLGTAFKLQPVFNGIQHDFLFE